MISPTTTVGHQNTEMTLELSGKRSLTWAEEKQIDGIFVTTDWAGSGSSYLQVVQQQAFGWNGVNEEAYDGKAEGQKLDEISVGPGNPEGVNLDACRVEFFALNMLRKALQAVEMIRVHE